MNSNLQVGYRAIWFSRMRICFIFVLAFGATPCVHARQPQIDELTNNVVEELIKTHEKAVVVFDFVGPDKKSTALGQKIADDFRDALTKSTAAFNVIDPAQITQALETNRVSPQILREPELEREAVQTWKFKPALGPDGKPAAVRQMVEMNFHQNK